MTRSDELWEMASAAALAHLRWSLPGLPAPEPRQRLDRFDAGTAFNRQLFDNRKLWLALAAVLVLQAIVVNWGPAQRVFDTVSLNLGDWLLATGIAASVLLLDEARKLAVWCWHRVGAGKIAQRVGSDR